MTLAITSSGNARSSEPSPARSSCRSNAESSARRCDVRTNDQSGTDRQAQHRVEPKTPPATAGKVLDPIFSPSCASKLSPSNSTKSYGLPPGPYPYPVAGVGSAVQAILNDTGNDAEPALHALAQKHLTVFTDPQCRGLDVPDWAQRVSSKAKVSRPFTVSGLVKTMYEVSETLGLERGKVYISAAICACADDALKDVAEGVQPQLALARSLGRLASTWAAFFLWPFYGRTPGEAPITLDDTSSNATPTEVMTEVNISNSLNPNRSGTLRDDVMRRDGKKCTVTGDHDQEDVNIPDPAPPGVFVSWLQVAHLFKRSVAVNGMADNPKFRSMAVTFEILQYYCQLSDKYIKDTDFVDTPENAITIAEGLHRAFDHLRWCLVPTTTPHVYQFKDYSPTLNQLRVTPSLVTFKDHSVADQHPLPGSSQVLGKRTRNQRGIDLPSPELIRLHAALAGVLNTSGAAGLFKIIANGHHHGEPPAPSSDGEAFWREVVDGRVLDDLRQSVHAIGLDLTPTPVE